MNWAASILVGLCAAVLAAIITGTAADSWAGWLRVSSREGAAGYWVVLMALLAAFVALVVGIAIARGWLLSTPHFFSALGTTVGLTAAVTLAITGLVRLSADLPPTIDGRSLELVAELRFPPGTTVESLPVEAPYVTIVRLSSGTSSGSGSVDYGAVRNVDGRPVVPVKLWLETSAARKMLNIGFAKGPNLFFPLGFGSKPAPKDLAWSDWIVAAQTAEGAPAPADETFALRYRLVVEPPPAPVLTSERQAADIDAQQEAALRALAPDAPLSQWLVFTRYGVPQPRIDAALAAIRARPDWAAEMTREMLEGDYESSRDALRAIEHIESAPAELRDGVAAVGSGIAGMLLELEKEPPDSERHGALVAAVSTRFSAWMVATRVLQERNVADFVPELKAIIEPARRLDPICAIRIDVVRVASFYLNKWAGIAPLPTDPPPR